MGLFSFLTQDIAIDLGTANTIIIMNDKMVVNEPSIVAVDKKTEKVIAIGERARQMQGKTHEYISFSLLLCVSWFVYLPEVRRLNYVPYVTLPNTPEDVMFI